MPAPRRIIAIQPADRQDAAPTLAFKSLPPLALYLHVPWCVAKCPYCDFNSHVAPADLPEAAYIDALIADLEHALPQIWGRPVHSLFFGGGTPSLVSAAGIDRLLAAIRARVRLLPEAEISLEANPGAVDAEKFADLRAAGINRLSIGIQSFQNAKLAALGRIHDQQAALAAARLAARHFDTFNLDLMYGLPGQTLADACADLDLALACAPTHLSCYQLTLEPNTRFAAFPPQLPDDERIADMQDALEARLAAAGFAHYETSAFARPGHACRHNLNYWQFGDYLGLGAGAHSKLTLPDRVLRQMRWKHPETYLAKTAAGRPIQSEHPVPAAELPFEFLMNALRLNAGFDPLLFPARTGQPLASIQPQLQAAARAGLLNLSPTCIAPTDIGRRFLNRLLGHFLP